MTRKLHISNLSQRVESDELGRLFAGHGTVRSAEVIHQFKAADVTGTGFVEMDTKEHGEAAIAALNGTRHRGSTLTVCWAKPGQRHGLNLSRMFRSMNSPDGETDPGQPVAGAG